MLESRIVADHRSEVDSVFQCEPSRHKRRAPIFSDLFARKFVVGKTSYSRGVAETVELLMGLFCASRRPRIDGMEPHTAERRTVAPTKSDLLVSLSQKETQEWFQSIKQRNDLQALQVRVCP